MLAWTEWLEKKTEQRFRVLKPARPRMLRCGDQTLSGRREGGAALRRPRPALP